MPSALILQTVLIIVLKFEFFYFYLSDPYDMFEIDPVTGRVRYIGPLREGLRTVTVVVLVRYTLFIFIDEVAIPPAVVSKKLICQAADPSLL